MDSNALEWDNSQPPSQPPTDQPPTDPPNQPTITPIVADPAQFFEYCEILRVHICCYCRVAVPEQALPNHKRTPTHQTLVPYKVKDAIAHFQQAPNRVMKVCEIPLPREPIPEIRALKPAKPAFKCNHCSFIGSTRKHIVEHATVKHGFKSPPGPARQKPQGPWYSVMAQKATNTGIGAHYFRVTTTQLAEDPPILMVPSPVQPQVSDPPVQETKSQGVRFELADVFIKYEFED